MAKLSICFLAILLTVSLDAGLSGYTGRYKNWNQFYGQQVGFASGKCSVLSGILPDPQSGCCGKHAGSDEDNQDNESNNTDDPNNEDNNKVDVVNNYDGIDDDNHENEDNQITDDDDDTSTSGDDDIDFGNNDIDNNNEESDAGDNNEIRDNDTSNDNEEDEDGVFENDDDDYGVENSFDDIFDDLKFNDAFNFNKWPQKLRSKRSIEKSFSDVVAPDKFIMAGKKAGLKQFSWLVHLEIRIRELFKLILVGCGGSLINPRFVLTAAHCVDVKVASLNDVSIFLAEYDTRTFPTDCVGNKCIQNVQMHPDKIIKHQDFEKNLLENDIALMRLKESAPYTEYIRPICLPSFNIDYPKNEGIPLQISGWGSTGSQSSPVKLVAEVQLLPHTQCKKHYSMLTTGHICAAGQSGQDTCLGDSGGPIMAEHEGNYYIVGIVSGKSSETQCGSSVPTLYTNVFKYTKWIKENMKV